MTWPQPDNVVYLEDVRRERRLARHLRGLRQERAARAALYGGEPADVTQRAVPAAWDGARPMDIAEHLIDRGPDVA